MNTNAYNTPLGKILISTDGNHVCKIRFATVNENYKNQPDPLADNAAGQLMEYFEGKRKQFDLPLATDGTRFQKKVWECLTSIPYGETRSYKQVAEMTGSARAYRAVGLANNKNPIAIVIPCHRVVGSDGGLVGYAGGIEIKKRLLLLERRGGTNDI